MATTAEFQRTLDEIRQQLFERPAFFKGTGVGVEDPSYDKEIAIFESLQAKLSLMIKGLQLAARNARGKVDRTKTRSRKEIDTLLADAQRLQETLKRVMSANSTIDPLDGAANLWNNQHEYHEANTSTHTEIPGSQYSDLHHVAHKDYAGTLESTALFVFTAMQAYILWMKRRRKKPTR